MKKKPSNQKVIKDHLKFALPLIIKLKRKVHQNPTEIDESPSLRVAKKRFLKLHNFFENVFK